MPRHAYRRWATLGLIAALAAAASLPFFLGSDARSRLLVWNSLLLAGGTCALAIPWGTVLAALLLRSDMPGRTAALLLVASMLFVPVYLQAAGWLTGSGIAGWYWWAAGVGGGEPWLSGWRGTIWIHGLVALPWVTLIVGLGLAAVPAEWEELALLEASPWRVFLHVTLRRSWGAVGIAALWVLVSTFGEMTVTDVFQLRTYAEELYTGFALDDLEAGPLGVMPGLIIVGWLTAAALVVCVRVLPQRGLTRMQPPRLYRLGCRQYAAVIFVAVTLVVLVGVPLLSLVYQAGVAVTGPEDARRPTWSALHVCYIVVVSVKANARELFWTVTIAALVAVAAIAVAVPLGWSARRGGLWLVPLLAVTAFCLALPAPLIGMGLIEAISQPGSTVLTFLRDRTVFAPWAAQLIRSLPLTLLIVWQALRTVPRETIELATIDGAGPGTRLTRVVLPQRSEALWAAALVAFAIAAGDAAATASDMVIPPGIDLLSRRIAGLLHASVTDMVAGICLVNWAFFVGIAMLVVWLLSRRHRRSAVGFDEL